MNIRRNTCIWCAALLAVGVVWARAAGAQAAASTGAGQAYPQKPVRLILPYLGATEFAGRWLAAKLSAPLGQQVVVDPRIGAGGRIGHEAAAKSPPDGYTLMLAAPPLVINPNLYPKPGYDALREFVAITQLGTIPSVLAVHPSVPVKSLRELTQLTRAQPKRISYGSGAAGSPSHLAGELFQSLTQSRILMVPYKGATFALVGAMSGEVDMVIPAASAAAPYVKDKRMRALAVLHTRAVDALPGVPIAAEAGMPQLLVVNWFVLMAPAGTPQAIVERLHGEVTKIMQTAESRQQFAALGGDVANTTPDQAAAFLREEFARWGKVIRDAKIKVDP